MPSSLNLVFRYHLIIPRTSSGPSQHRLDPFQGCIFFTESRLIRCNNSFFPQFLAQKILFFCLRSARKVFFFFFKLVNVWSLYSFFPQLLAQKILILFLSSARACFFWPKKSFSFFRIGQFLALILNFSHNFWPKKSFFLKLSTSFFFWPAKSFFL